LTACLLPGSDSDHADDQDEEAADLAEFVLEGGSHN
jgi:hypothetical protein